MDKFYNKYIAKLAVDLIKIDRVIHPKELEFLDELMKEYGMENKIFKHIHHLTLEECLSKLKNLSEEERKKIISSFQKLIYVDNDLNVKERFLFFSIKLALSEDTKRNVQIISTSNLSTDFYSKQIIYLEKAYAPHLNKEIKAAYKRIHTLFNKEGLDFIYLPEILDHIKKCKDESVDKVMKYLIPVYSSSNNWMETVGTSDFYSYIFKSIDKNTTPVQFETFLLLKIQTSFVVSSKDNAWKKVVDFLCFNIHKNVMECVWDFCDYLSLEEEKDLKVFYGGYYKMLFNIISEKSKVKSKIVLDGLKKSYSLKDLPAEKGILFKSIQEKVLYLLYLIYGKKGITKNDFTHVMEILKTERDKEFETSEQADEFNFVYEESLKNDPNYYTQFIYNMLVIYKFFNESPVSKVKQSGKFVALPSKLFKICDSRSHLRSKINERIGNTHSLKNIEDYLIHDSDHNTIHYVTLSLDEVEVLEAGFRNSVSFFKSKLYKGFRLGNLYPY